MIREEKTPITEPVPLALVNKPRIRVLQVLNFVFFLLMVAVNYLAVALPINGKTTGELSNQYPNLFVPAGFTFAIWGVIYTLLLAFCIYQVQSLFSRRTSVADAVVSRMGGLFMLSCVFNMAWIVAWHYEFTLLSVGIMLAFLLTLVTIYQRLGIGFNALSRGEKWFVHVPFSVYLGWISIATIANVTAWLVDNSWGGFGFNPNVWTVFMLAVGVTLAAYMVLVTNGVFFGLVAMWAYFGIAARQYQSEDPSRIVAYAAMAGLVLVAIMVVARFRRWHSY